MTFIRYPWFDIINQSRSGIEISIVNRSFLVLLLVKLDIF